MQDSTLSGALGDMLDSQSHQNEAMVHYLGIWICSGMESLESNEHGDIWAETQVALCLVKVASRCCLSSQQEREREYHFSSLC